MENERGVTEFKSTESEEVAILKSYLWRDNREKLKRKTNKAELKRMMGRMTKRDLGDLPEPSENEELAIKNNFRPYAELKEALIDLGLQSKSDSETMVDHLSEYRSTNTTDRRRLIILEELEYYVHQIDNAENFVKMNGFSLVKDALNHSDNDYRRLACYLTGSAVQSNPKVQIAAVENGLLHQMVQQFPLETDEAVRKKYIYAISGVLRNFPYAQEKFLQLGGVAVISDILKHTEFPDQQVKIMTLIHDLILEKHALVQEMEANSEVVWDENDLFVKKYRQYQRVKLLEIFEQNEWCTALRSLLNSNFLSRDNLDGQEKVLSAMSFLSGTCGQDINQAKDSLRSLKSAYEIRLQKEADNDYVQSLLTMVTTLLEVGANGKEEL